MLKESKTSDFDGSIEILERLSRLNSQDRETLEVSFLSIFRILKKDPRVFTLKIAFEPRMF